MTELLAPAGSIDCAYAAINSGADAIYLGSRVFSARASAENFDEEGLSSLLRYAKLLGVKVYLAMNTLVKDAELPEFIDTMIKAWNLGVDAVILQDVFLGKYISTVYPQICLHLSTQAGVCNQAGAYFAKENGFSRVILARETPLDEIEKITKIIETEVFVQGALCTCFSGQCYFSSFVGGNSGNRGRCKQPCRKQYALDREGYEEKSYAISPADLCVGADIEKLLAAGVTSFKIEGRMRRAEYVAAATSYYRALLDEHEETSLSALKRTYNRGNYTKGLAFGQDKNFLSRNVQGHLGEKVGTIKVENKKYVVDSAFKAAQGDAFKILRKGKEVGGAYFLEKTRKGFILSSSSRLCAGDSVFVTTDTTLNEKLLAKKRTRRLSLALDFSVGQPATVAGDDVQCRTEFVLQEAKTKPLTEEEIKSCFLKTDGLPLEIEFARITLQGDVFLRKADLNEFRRNFYARLLESVQFNRDLTVLPIKIELRKEKNISVKGIIARDFADVDKIDVGVYKADDYENVLPTAFLEGAFEKYLYVPAFCTSNDLVKIVEIVRKYSLNGVYAENFGALFMAKKEGFRCFAGTGFNVTNSISANCLSTEPQISHFVLSKELSEKELSTLQAKKAMVLVGGDLKLMDLCYCPFEKTCARCDKRYVYTMTDEQSRQFPIHRYQLNGRCRFEVYNAARLIQTPLEGFGALADYTVTYDILSSLRCWDDEEKQKKLQKNYTYGHAKNGVL